MTSKIQTDVLKNVNSSVDNLTLGTSGQVTVGGSLNIGGNYNITGSLTLGSALSVANGGTGTGTAFTAGSVVFAGTSGVYSQDNSQLFWNTTTKRLGIGSSNPGGAIGDERVRITGTDTDGWPLAIEDSAGTVASGFYAANNVAGVGNFSADPFIFLTQNTEKMRLDASGDLRILGAGSSGSPAVSFSGSAASNSLVLNASGNLSLGYTAPNSRLGIFNSQSDGAQTCANAGLLFGQTGGWAQAGIWPLGGAGFSGSLVFGTVASGSTFTVTERARIDSTGRLLMPAANVFDTITLVQLDASAAARAALAIKAGTNNFCQTFYAFNNTSLGGSITTSGTTTTYGTSSDYRLKENVQPMSGALSRIAKLKPVTYNWKADNSSGEGFIAHELQTVVPLSVIGERDAVTGDGNIAPQQVDYAKLTPILTAAIQELAAKVQALEAKVQ